MIKLRLGLNMKTQRLYAKLRFRTEPMSPFDIGDGLSCAGRLPLPMYLLPSFTRSLPLRVEYRVRINTSRGPQHHHYERTQQSKRGHRIMGHNSSPQRVVSMSTGLGAVDVSLDELNFCLEWDETSPVWVRDCWPSPVLLSLSLTMHTFILLFLMHRALDWFETIRPGNGYRRCL